MDWMTTATAIGAGIGTIAATYATLIHRANLKRIDAVESVSIPKAEIEQVKKTLEETRKEAEAARTRLTQIETELRGVNEQHREVQNRVRQIEQAQRSLVTDEEFQAHVSETTKSVNQLTEKMGRAIGVIESWGRQR